MRQLLKLGRVRCLVVRPIRCLHKNDAGEYV
jgi:hypothetical protein